MEDASNLGCLRAGGGDRRNRLFPNPRKATVCPKVRLFPPKNRLEPKDSIVGVSDRAGWTDSLAWYSLGRKSTGPRVRLSLSLSLSQRPLVSSQRSLGVARWRRRVPERGPRATFRKRLTASASSERGARHLPKKDPRMRRVDTGVLEPQAAAALPRFPGRAASKPPKAAFFSPKLIRHTQYPRAPPPTKDLDTPRCCQVDLPGYGHAARVPRPALARDPAARTRKKKQTRTFWGVSPGPPIPLTTNTTRYSLASRVYARTKREGGGIR